MSLKLLTAPEAIESPTKADRYFVELASRQMVADCEGVPVSSSYMMLDVCVVGGVAEIATLLEATGYLKFYRLVNYWQPEDCDCF